MENYDQRRRRDEERQQARSEDHGRDRDSWWRPYDDDRPRRAERGWLDYDRDYGQSDEWQSRRDEGRENQRYGERDGGERARFSPDWSREGERPRYSDEPYYARNRERSRQGRDDQRMRDEDQSSHYRGWYSRSSTPFSYPGGSGYLYSETLSLHGPYAGRGPKGYKRNDQQIVEEACQRLERDGEVDASEIEVTVEDGIIRLRGSVPDRQTKRRAEQCVESIYGARDVMNELRVTPQGSEQSQASRTAQSGRESQSSQGAQAAQTSQGSSPAMRPTTGDQSGDDKRTVPRH